jgi:hypothetical protein
MITINDIQKAILTLQNPKVLKKIKVTSAFASYLAETLPKFEDKPTKLYNGIICRLEGVPIEIDDSLDSNYEFIF